MLQRQPKQTSPTLRLDTSIFQRGATTMNAQPLCFDHRHGSCDFPIGHFELYALIESRHIACWTNTCDDGCRVWTTEETESVDEKLSHMSARCAQYQLGQNDSLGTGNGEIVTGGYLQHLNLIVTISFFKA